ncbi:MAG: aminotransferase class I/II-fold pyridoxal phosphate-dependent enzyme, partial [Sphingomonas sp.]
RNPSHIIPVMIKDPVKCRMISEVLMDDFGIYVQPINYPTVPRGTERLRFTPGPSQTETMMRELTQALVEIWDRMEMRIAA